MIAFRVISKVFISHSFIRSIMDIIIFYLEELIIAGNISICRELNVKYNSLFFVFLFTLFFFEGKVNYKYMYLVSFRFVQNSKKMQLLRVYFMNF